MSVCVSKCEQMQTPDSLRGRIEYSHSFILSVSEDHIPNILAQEMMCMLDTERLKECESHYVNDDDCSWQCVSECIIMNASTAVYMTTMIKKTMMLMISLLTLTTFVVITMNIIMAMINALIITMMRMMS